MYGVLSRSAWKRNVLTILRAKTFGMFMNLTTRVLYHETEVQADEPFSDFSIRGGLLFALASNLNVCYLNFDF